MQAIKILFDCHPLKFEPKSWMVHKVETNSLGEKDGMETWSSPEGEILKQTQYSNDIKNGSEIIWDEEGYRLVLPYRNGKLNGCAFLYRYDNINALLVYENDQRSGKYAEYEWWCQSVEGQFLNGERCGIWKEWEEDTYKSCQIGECTYQNGKLITIMTRMGCLRKYQSDGLKEGTWKIAKLNPVK